MVHHNSTNLKHKISILWLWNKKDKRQCSTSTCCYSDWLNSHYFELTPWGRVLEKVMAAQLVNIFPAFYGTSWFTSPSPVAVQPSSVQCSLNAILKSLRMFHNWLTYCPTTLLNSDFNIFIGAKKYIFLLIIFFKISLIF